MKKILMLSQIFVNTEVAHLLHIDGSLRQKSAQPRQRHRHAPRLRITKRQSLDSQLMLLRSTRLDSQLMLLRSTRFLAWARDPGGK